MAIPTRAWKANDGTIYHSLPEVKVSDLMGLVVDDGNPIPPEAVSHVEIAIERLVLNHEKAIAILKLKERKPRTVKPKVAKPAKAKGKKVTESEAAVA